MNTKTLSVQRQAAPPSLNPTATCHAGTAPRRALRTSPLKNTRAALEAFNIRPSFSAHKFILKNFTQLQQNQQSFEKPIAARTAVLKK
jgi:hypothetical protein